MQEDEPTIKAESDRGWFSADVFNQPLGLNHQRIICHPIVEVGIVVVAEANRLVFKKTRRVGYRLHPEADQGEGQQPVAKPGLALFH